MIKKLSATLLLLIVTIYFFDSLPVQAEDKDGLSNGQMVYIPAYSHIYIGDRESPYLLTITLSIRNIDPKNEITITSVKYYESQGELLKEYLDTPIVLRPLESIRYVVPERDKSGGSGANFIVVWHTEKYVNPPVLESIMIGTQAQQGISFTSQGRVIQPTD